MAKTAIEYRLALWLTSGLGPVIYKKIIEQYPNLQEFFELGRVGWQAIGFKQKIVSQLESPHWQKVDKTLAWAQNPNCYLTFLDSSNYPKLLKHIPDPPLVLMLQGQINWLNKSQISIVGSRNPTNYGEEAAYQYAHFLTKAGLIITSGLAAGIDAAAHRGAKNQTIAVLGTGINVCYPQSQTKLLAKIREQGLVISEFELDTAPMAYNFPKRNRIISGLSLATLVIEAALKSGSLITAKFALEQGKEVFAIPGSIHNPLAKGCHWLIKQGANLVESTHDIWEQIQCQSLNLVTPEDKKTTLPHFSQKQISPNANNNNLSKLQQKLLDAIGFDRTPMEILIQRMQLSPQSLAAEVLELEMLHLIETVPGGIQRRDGNNLVNE